MAPAVARSGSTSTVDGEEWYKMPVYLPRKGKYRITVSAEGRYLPLAEMIASGDAKLVL